MIDLCIDARMAFSSGIGTCIRHLVPFFNHPPFRVTLLVDQKGQDWCEGIEQILVTAPIYSVQEQIALTLKIPRCDLFWSPHYNIPLGPIRAKKRVVTIHDACHLALSEWLSLPEKAYAKIVMKAAMRRSNAVVTGSLFSRNELIHFLGAPRNSLEVVPIGVDRGKFQSVVEGAAQKVVRQTYNLPEKFILYVGNLKPHKNLSGLVQAFYSLPNKDFNLVIVGKGKGLRNAQEISGDGIYRIEGISDKDLSVLYTLAQVLVFPSFYEGFGLPPLEAMSCGCPTIVSNAASMPEVCGDATIYIDPHKPTEIAKAISRIIDDQKLRTELIFKGLKRVEKFNWEKTAITYLDLFKRIHNE